MIKIEQRIKFRERHTGKYVYAWVLNEWRGEIMAKIGKCIKVKRANASTENEIK